MSELPATFCKNPRYISSYTTAISLLSDKPPIDIHESKFVALYHYSDQVDQIIFTDDQIIVLSGDNILSLELKNIKKSRHHALNATIDEFEKKPDAICITTDSNEEHIVEVMGHSGRIRDAFSINKLIAILKRRQLERSKYSCYSRN